MTDPCLKSLIHRTSLNQIIHNRKFWSPSLGAMEIQGSTFVTAFFLFFLLHWLTKSYKKKTNGLHKLPPGPWKLPLIGNLHQVALAGSLPHQALHKLAKKYGPLMHLQLGEMSEVVVSSPKLAEEIMKTHDLSFVDRPRLLATKVVAYGPTNIVFSPYGDYWRQMRRILISDFLSAKKVQSFSSIREDEAAKLRESIQSLSGSPVNLTKIFYSLISTCVSREAFGDNFSEKDQFFALVKKAIQLAVGFDLADLFPSLKSIGFVIGFKAKLEKVHRQIDKILEKIVNEHQEKQKRRKERGSGEEGEENIVDVYLRLQQSGTLEIPITTTNVKAVIWDIFTGATHTSASALGWAMSELMKNPRTMEKAQTEVREACRGKKTIHENDLDKLSYLKLVIKETMRLHPPAPLLLPRECREPTIIDGYNIAKNTRVIVNAWAIGRDPEYWQNAESFTPERFEGSSNDFKGTNFEYIPFGAGRRICPGISFGLANIELPLAQLLYHFNWDLPNGIKPEDLDMTEAFGISVGRKDDLCLIPTYYV